MASNYEPHRAPRRPSMISELAARAQQTSWDENGSFKYFLRLAERNRKEGKEAVARNDLEGAFIAFARAASIVLEKLPNHRDYNTALTVTQRHNLSLNGQEILDNLGHLKPILLDRYDRWLSQHPNGVESDSPPNQPQVAAEQDDRERVRAQQEREWIIQEEAQRAAQEAEIARRRQQEEMYAPQTVAASSAVASARQAAGLDPAEAEQRHQRQQEEMHLRSQEMMRRRAEQRAKESEYNGRTTPYYSSTSSSAVTTSSSALSMPPPATTTSASSVTPSTVYSEANKYPQAMSVPSSSIYHPPPPVSKSSSFYQPPSKPAYRDETRFVMPLESPSKNDTDSSDSDAAPGWHPGKQHRAVEHSTPTKPLSRSSSYPPPITTTSPPPQERIEYPQLMSQHQKTQGYTPSLNSMFRPDLEKREFQENSLLLDGRGWDSRDLYSSNMLPNPSTAAPPPSMPHHQHPRSYSHHNPLPQPPSDPPYPGYPPPTRAAPPVPSAFSHPGAYPPSASSSENTTPTESIYRGAPGGTSELKTVIVPRESLSKFLTIAKVNTSRNRETCGLLLGKDKGNRFQVTTLLIPKQHSTSDTCTMDEEELILQVTEERNLITLGWIHTHPTQSCFMSSVDLHTHSGFQRMLPESFAVVCAPKSKPNFGIFRLTDPPGLQTILDCTDKEAFHPHPDIPIYTDADRGHVQMKDLPLEIVDLR